MIPICYLVFWKRASVKSVLSSSNSLEIASSQFIVSWLWTAVLYTLCRKQGALKTSDLN